jgi:diacylglycerol kinase (ATP)
VSRRPILLLVNPVAGGKLASGPDLADDPALLEPQALADALGRRGLSVALHVLEEDDDAAALAAAAASSGSDVVAAGGDGTVSVVARGLVGTPAALGVLALGSFNNIAHGYGIPRRLDAALAVIERGAISEMDVGIARQAASSERILFFEAAGVGLDAAGFGAVELTERRGWWRGARIILRALRQRRRAMTVVLDGRSRRTRAPAVTVCNGPYLGMGFALAADADPADGLFDVVVFAGMGRFEVLRHFARVARGARRREPRLRIVRAREVSVRATRGVLPAHADGHSIGFTPVTFTVRPAALRVFR